MAFDFQFPDVGEGIHEGKIVKWLVKEGDTVKMDQGLAEVETDKAVVEIPTPKAGKITKLYHQEGEVIKVGEVLVSIEETGAATSPTANPPAQQTPVKTPDEQGALVKQAEAKEPAKAAEQPKEEPKKESTGVVGALEETAAGVLKAPSMEQSGAVFGAAESTFQEVKSFQPPIQNTQTAVTEAQTGKISAQQAAPDTPAGKNAPTQPTEQNVQAAQEPAQQPQTSGGIGVTKAGLKAVKKYDLFGYIDHVKYDSVRKAVGDHMVKSMSTIPHVTHTELVDVNKLWKIREKEKVKAEKQNIKLTFLPFFIKAVIAGLKKHPFLNASLDETVPEIILKKYYNIGIAVDTEAGLMVPVIKGADKKSILELAKEILELAEKARNRKLNSMDMKGGTFTITNIGSAGGGFLATPVINFPEAAILGTGMIQDMPVARNGKVVIRKILPLMVSFDHRILDGAEAARFAMTLKEHLEDPDLMLVEGK